MKLYYSPGACSLSPHIVALEAGVPIELVKVNTKNHSMVAENDYYEVNPKGYVPALGLDNGELLTEGPAIVQYLADLKPGSGLAPANGTFERSRTQEMLGYINSEIHKSYSSLFSDKTSPELRAEKLELLKRRYALVERQLAGRDYLFGETFTVADAYLFTVTRWAHYTKLDLSPFPNVLAFQDRVAARPAVHAALKAEGLAK